MSGHNRWSTIKHKKAAVDAKRGKLFSKLIKEITVAARHGGGHPETNPRLRTAVAAAKSANMPSDNIDRAIKKGTGELPGITYEEVTYEGYGPAGVAILIDVLTDNKKRAVSEVRNIFSKLGGNMGELGCVCWMFTRMGFIMIPKDGTDEIKLMEVALDSGALDIKDIDDYFEVYTDANDFNDVREAIENANFNIESADITAVPQTTVKLNVKDAQKLIRLLNAMEDSDEVQKVYSNMDIPDEVLIALEK